MVRPLRLVTLSIGNRGSYGSKKVRLISAKAKRNYVAITVGAVLVFVMINGLLILCGRDGKTRGCAVSASLVPSCGPWWGSALDSGNSALAAAVTDRERATDRRLDIVHTYHRWFDSFPTATERAIATSGHLLFLNWEPVDAGGVAMSWAAIAAGSHDREIRALGARLKAFGRPVLLSFSHEPEASYPAHGGSASDFVAAFRHVHDLVGAAGASQVRWVWNTMGLADPVWRGRYRQLYPGDRYVDWIAWDPYNWADCRQRDWQSFAQTVTPFYQWLEANGFGNKPFMLAEFGSVEQPGQAGRKADWFTQIPAALAHLSNLKALVYFDLPRPPANCDWQISTSPESAAGYRAAAQRLDATAKLATR